MEMRPQDEKLIHYLAQNGHMSPFYHPQLMFRVKAPISVQRQWFKHKIGTAENSESTRYVEVADEFYIPDMFRTQSTNNKQGSGDWLSAAESAKMRQAYVSAVFQSFRSYQHMIQAGVAKEQAREVLPLCTYTSWVWTASLAAVAHFIHLRSDNHAQYEIRQYAHVMLELVEPLFPISLGALLRAKEAQVPVP